ncbi:MAG: TVP38/TMEM64 family protein [Phycisphaerae bacterium]|nr:VTT domain-containing protein [Tepidisphaeraceae bacterium]
MSNIAPAILAEPAMPTRRPWVRVAVMAVVLAGALVAFYFSPARAWLADHIAVRRTLDSLGVWAYPACVLGVALLVMCGAPRLLLAAIGAMALGFWWGLALTQAGALLGYYGVFCFVRWGGRDWVLRRWPALCKLADRLQDHGVAGVFLVRQVPVHGSLTNLCLGLSNVKHGQFLIGSALGLLPEAVPVALVGAGLVRGSLTDALPYLAAAGVALAVLWVAGAYVVRAARRSRAGELLASDPVAP